MLLSPEREEKVKGLLKEKAAAGFSFRRVSGIMKPEWKNQTGGTAMEMNKELLDTHSPAEAGSLEDIQGCVDLLARFLADLDPGLDLTWY